MDFSALIKIWQAGLILSSAKSKSALSSPYSQQDFFVTGPD
jgi:hypothetical protein